MALPGKAKVFMSGRSQHVTIPAAFRFRSSEVTIRRDEATGEIILSEVPNNWNDVFAQLDAANIPDDFLSEAERGQESPQVRPALEQLFEESPEIRNK
jgi:antitoxin VapB